MVADAEIPVAQWTSTPSPQSSASCMNALVFQKYRAMFARAESMTGMCEYLNMSVAGIQLEVWHTRRAQRQNLVSCAHATAGHAPCSQRTETNRNQPKAHTGIARRNLRAAGADVRDLALDE
eukprot:SAG31_NODE_20413_length_575_cov_1.063025_1_plen_121_part_01